MIHNKTQDWESAAATALFRKISVATGLALLATLTAQAGQGPQPGICSRSCWGARAPTCGITQMSALTRAIIHHTAGTGDYSTSLENSKSRVRGVQNLHISYGWCDIAYHFLVDAAGNIFEGRSGSWSGLPRGTHDGCNNNSFGFTALGYYHPPYNQAFTSATRNSLEAVIAWRMPSGWSPYGSSTYCSKSVGYMDGHYKVYATACPGDGIIGQLAGMRDGVNARKNGGAVLNPPYLFGSGLDGWTPGNKMSPLTWTDCCGFPGVIYGDQNGDDAWIYGPACNFVGGADTFINVDVIPQNGTTAGHEMQAYWKTSAENFWDQNKASQKVSFVKQNEGIRINLDITSSRWTGQTINQLRLDFDDHNQAVRWIVNHIYPQQAPRWWFTSGTDGWTLGNSLSGLTWTDCCGFPGIIYADQTGTDAYFYSPVFSGLGYLGAANDVILVGVLPQNGNTANHQMKVYWITNADGTWNETKSSVIVPFTAQNTWTMVTIPVGQNPYWSRDFVKQIRLDVDDANTATRWIIDYVALSAQPTQQ